MKNTFAFLIILILVATGCSTTEKPSAPYLEQGEGYVEVKGGKIWYGIMGEGRNTPLVCLHGGPGGTSSGYYNFAELSKDRPVILFDQLGTGRSDHHQDTSLLHVDLFVEQVNAITTALELDEFYLVGGSWGTALGLEYYTKYPEGVKGIVFNSPYFSTQVWTDDADKLVAALPDTVRLAIQEAERDSVFNTEAYDAANTFFARKHGRRKERIKHPYDSVPSERNSFIYNYMWGPSEFTATGTLRDYDNLENLKKVKVPTLFTTGEFDEARPETVSELSHMVPGAKFVVIPDAGHSTLNDNGPALRSAIQEFLDELEK